MGPLVWLGLGALVLLGHFNPEARRKRSEERDRAREEEERRLAAEDEARQRLRRLRDADTQDEPYTYQVGEHANSALAIRYGIANQERLIKEYWYHAKGGELTRNPSRDRFYFAPSRTIRVQKVRKLKSDMYLVKLCDYRNREARAVIERGQDYIKTFYPLDDEWFEKHSDLELVLKGNPTFNLKELAAIHVQKAVSTP